MAPHGSGEIILAFSTANRVPEADHVETPLVQHTGSRVLSMVFHAAMEAVEESLLNALFAAHTVSGRDGVTVHALPLDRVVAHLQQVRPDLVVEAG